MKTAEEIIRETVEAGQPLSHAQALLRRGYDPSQITADLAIQSLAIQQEEIIRLAVGLFAEAIKLMGAEVNAEGMGNAYIESIRLAQDAFFYDVLNSAPVEVVGSVDPDGFEYDATILGEEE